MHAYCSGREINLCYKTSADKVYKRLNSLSYFVTGPNGTILSLGCYSECMDKENIQQTQALLRKIIPLGNKIQLATKQKISEKIVQEISKLRKYRSQVTIYVSMPTASSIENIEPGTASYEMRIFNFELCKRYDIPVVLYIKPFLKGITDRDLDKYVGIVQKYQVPIVVGSYLSVDLKKSTQSDVGEGLLYWYDRGGCKTIKMTYNAALKKRIVRHDLIEKVGLDRNQYWGFFELTNEQFDRIAQKGDVTKILKK